VTDSEHSSHMTFLTFSWLPLNSCKRILWKGKLFWNWLHFWFGFYNPHPHHYHRSGRRSQGLKNDGSATPYMEVTFSFRRVRGSWGSATRSAVRLAQWRCPDRHICTRKFVEPVVPDDEGSLPWDAMSYRNPHFPTVLEHCRDLMAVITFVAQCCYS
jgi:hypothetical protein